MISRRPLPLLLSALLCLLAFPALGEEDISRMNLLDDDRPLSVGDRLLYSVIEERDPPVVLFVNDRNEVDVPLIGMVSSDGLTSKSFAYKVKNLLEGDFFHRATVMVRHQNAENVRGRINLVGQVRQQGPLLLPADEVLTISSAILRAGGFLPGANRSQVSLLRNNDLGEETEQVVDVAAILETGDFDQDIILRPEDLIVVPKLAQAGGQVYIVGAVRAPGLYDLPNEANFTVSKAILRAGGFNKFANQRRVRLIRSDESLPEDEREIVVNVEDILERGNRENDPVVRANDIIRIEESWINF